MPEKYLEKYAVDQNFPIIPCNLCGSQPNLQRNAMKELLKQWGKTNPGRVESIFRALTHVVPSHLMDANLFNFKDLEIGTDTKINFGDLAIDEGLEDVCATDDEFKQIKMYSIP